MAQLSAQPNRQWWWSVQTAAFPLVFPSDMPGSTGCLATTDLGARNATFAGCYLRVAAPSAGGLVSGQLPLWATCCACLHFLALSQCFVPVTVMPFRSMC